MVMWTLLSLPGQTFYDDSGMKGNLLIFVMNQCFQTRSTQEFRILGLFNQYRNLMAMIIFIYSRSVFIVQLRC